MCLPKNRWFSRYLLITVISTTNSTLPYPHKAEIRENNGKRKKLLEKKKKKRNEMKEFEENDQLSEYSIHIFSVKCCDFFFKIFKMVTTYIVRNRKPTTFFWATLVCSHTDQFFSSGSWSGGKNVENSPQNPKRHRWQAVQSVIFFYRQKQVSFLKVDLLI